VNDGNAHLPRHRDSRASPRRRSCDAVVIQIIHFIASPHRRTCRETVVSVGRCELAKTPMHRARLPHAQSTVALRMPCANNRRQSVDVDSTLPRPVSLSDVSNKAGIPRRRRRHGHPREYPRRHERHARFVKLFLWQDERHANVLTRMSARISVSVSASWNASLTDRRMSLA